MATKKTAVKKDSPEKKPARKTEPAKGTPAAKQDLAKQHAAPVKRDKKELPSEFSQPMVNIGLVGHVDHGKTTLTQALSGKWADTHSEEMKRGITIRLGYADVVFRYDEKTGQYTTANEVDGRATLPKRMVSFVDAPGHESLMATMLAGARIMDGALLLVAANEPCPQPQTREHLMALEISGIRNVVVVQNKIDLVDKERALRNYQQIKDFLKGTPYESAPVIPVSAQQNVNVDMLIAAIEEFIPTPERDKAADPVMFVARSFDINKPGITPDKLQGGVLGGALVAGALHVGDRIEIRPGRIVEEANQIVAKPLFTNVLGLMAGGRNVEELVPGGTMAIMTDLDPSIVKSDSLVGNVVGREGKLPPVWRDLTLQTYLLERVVGSFEELKVDPIRMSEVFMLDVNSAATVGVVTELQKNLFTCKLKLPVCAELGARVAISRRVGTRFRLIGYGEIVSQKK